jgi:pyruvate dehydrogenase E2 component (dihydrolipoamide acetyltransferase)
MDFRLPELGEGIESATVVNVLVQPGAEVAPGQDVLEVETEKASMPVASTAGGTVEKVLVKPGDKVKVGAVILTLSGAAAKPEKAKPTEKAPAKPEAAPAEAPSAAEPRRATPPADGNGAARREAPAPAPAEAGPPVPAGPATRRLARELGVDLRQVEGSARGGRVTVEDLKSFVRSNAGRPAPAAGGGITTPPLPDFTKYGPVERKPFTGLRKAIARNLSLAWAVAPQVTQHDLADITDLEAGRKRFVESAAKGTPKVTMTAIVIKACVAALKQFPHFNASYDPTAGENGELIVKGYFHIGVAVDTERGLVVPVVRDADKKTVLDLAREVSGLAEKARAGKLVLEEMKGGTFTVTNLGGIGGTAFSPILNYPEVAILGLSRSSLQPVVRDGQIVPRLMLPLSLTYDHRVIDGADGARFAGRLAQLLSDPTRLLLEG